MRSTEKYFANERTTGVTSRSKEYVLATGAKAVDRLHLLDQIFGPASRQLLIRAGLPSTRRVAELGCGTGLMALWIAGQLGAEGALSAVDSSEAQLEVADANARAAGLQNVSFHAATAEDTRLARGSFDLVYSRFLMCHLTNPLVALKEMSEVLRPGGVLVCEDFEMSAVGTRPQTDAYRSLIEVSRAVDRQRGVDSDIGAKLHTLFVEAGYKDPEIAVYEPSFLRGEAKRFWALTLREAESAIVAGRIEGSDRIDSICNDLERIAKDDSVLVLIARVFQVWARKP